MYAWDSFLVFMDSSGFFDLVKYCQIKSWNTNAIHFIFPFLKKKKENSIQETVLQMIIAAEVNSTMFYNNV